METQDYNLAEVSKAIGDCVIGCQLFETLFVMLCKRVLPPEHQHGPIEPLSPGDWKQASKALFNELKTKIDIDPDYEARFERFVKDRHTVIHRGVIQLGFSGAWEDYR